MNARFCFELQTEAVNNPIISGASEEHLRGKRPVKTSSRTCTGSEPLEWICWLEDNSSSIGTKLCRWQEKVSISHQSHRIPLQQPVSLSFRSHPSFSRGPDGEPPRKQGTICSFFKLADLAAQAGNKSAEERCRTWRRT